MVAAVTNLGRNGLSDWLIQRFTAVVLTAYTLFIVLYLALHPDLTYLQWQTLFASIWMRIATFIVLLSVAAHGWIGLWSVLTDYITTRTIGGPAVALRVLALGLYALVTLAFLIWGVEILWGLQ